MGLLYRFEGAAMFLVYLEEQETASRAREYLVVYERSETKYLVTRGEAVKIGAQLCCPTIKDPHWTIVPFGSFFLCASFCVQSFPL